MFIATASPNWVERGRRGEFEPPRLNVGIALITELNAVRLPKPKPDRVAGQRNRNTRNTRSPLVAIRNYKTTNGRRACKRTHDTFFFSCTCCRNVTPLYVIAHV